jgi:hypothetical protein
MVARTVEYKGYKIEVIPDDDAQNPRKEFDNLGTMVCFHGRYDLGDEGHGYVRSGNLRQDIEKDCPNCVILPLYLYDHSGLTMKTTPFSCPWDSGQVGYIFISLYDARKEYGWKSVTKKRRAQLEDFLRGEVSLYDSYLRGDVYGYRVLDPKGEEIDSCWGYYGDDEESGLLDAAKNHINWTISKTRKDHFEQLKKWIRGKVDFKYRRPLSVTA